MVPAFRCSITSSAALRAGTPNGPAAGPERKVTKPIRRLGASWAKADAAVPSPTASARPARCALVPLDIISLPVASRGEATRCPTADPSRPGKATGQPHRPGLRATLLLVHGAVAGEMPRADERVAR